MSIFTDVSEAKRFSETSVVIYQSTRHKIGEELNSGVRISNVAYNG